MKCIINGKLVIGKEVFENKCLLFDEKIRAIIEKDQIDNYNFSEIIDAENKYVSPGFIDIHIHGAVGEDASDGNEDGLKKICNHITKNGVTSFLPTTMTIANEDLKNALNTIRRVKNSEYIGAEIIGVHLEGPFISKDYKGAQDGKYITEPDFSLVEEFKDILSIITIAPEIDGAKEFIKRVVKETDIVLSMGHSSATFEEAMKAIDSGISHATHTFNAMTGLHHRNPGCVGATLASDIKCELIADTIHVHPGIFNLLVKTKGLDKILLITDCMRAGGLPEGTFSLGGQSVKVKDNKPVLSDGTLAGSVLKLSDAVYNFSKFTDVSIPKIISLVTENPAKSLGIYNRKGSLDVGKDADIVMFDETVKVSMTIGKGIVLYEEK